MDEVATLLNDMIERGIIRDYAEALHCPLLTCDGRLARAPGLSRWVELVS